MKIYIIVQGGNLAELQEKVEELCVEGYDPVGGVTQVVSQMVQAVYKPRIIDLLRETVNIPHYLSPTDAKSTIPDPGGGSQM